MPAPRRNLGNDPQIPISPGTGPGWQPKNGMPQMPGGDFDAWFRSNYGMDPKDAPPALYKQAHDEWAKTDPQHGGPTQNYQPGRGFSTVPFGGSGAPQVGGANGTDLFSTLMGAMQGRGGGGMMQQNAPGPGQNTTEGSFAPWGVKSKNPKAGDFLNDWAPKGSSSGGGGNPTTPGGVMSSPLQAKEGEPRWGGGDGGPGGLGQKSGIGGNGPGYESGPYTGTRAPNDGTITDVTKNFNQAEEDNSLSQLLKSLFGNSGANGSGAPNSWGGSNYFGGGNSGYGG